MAIKECKECKHEVSSKAKSCPNCGVKIKKCSWGGWLLVAVLIAVAVFLLPTITSEMKGHRSFEEVIQGTRSEIIEGMVEDFLSKEYGIQCVSLNLVRGSKDYFAGDARLEDGREVHVTAIIKGELVEFTSNVKSGFEYKCKHHLDKTTLVVSKKNWAGILTGRIWNDGNKPITVFYVADFVDHKGRILATLRGYSSEVDPIRPGNHSTFAIKIAMDLAKEADSVSIEFFDLGELASLILTAADFDPYTGLFSYDTSSLDMINVKKTAKPSKLKKVFE